MGYEQPLFKVGLYPSDDDRSVTATNQFYGVMLGATKNNVVGTGQGNAAIVYPTAGGPIFGVLQNNPLQGEACELTCQGICKAKATGAFDVGDPLSVDAQGGFVKQSGTQTVVAYACEQGTSGAIVAIYLK
jgi:hypothetical protein